MSDDQGQKTELPTRRKLERAKESGNVPYSREVAAVLLVGCMVFFAKFPPASKFLEILSFMKYVFEHSSEMSGHDLVVFVIKALRYFIVFLLFPFAVLVSISILSGILQNKFTITFSGVAFNLQKVSPIQGLKKIFSAKALSEFIITIVKILSIGVFVYLAIKSEASILTTMFLFNMSEFLSQFVRMLGDVLRSVFILIVFFVIIDVSLKRYFYIRSLMMTKQEVKDEMKEMELRPEVKAKMKKLRASILKSMIREVARADVVVTNPEHLSIALKYEVDAMPAPKVVAKGSGNIAIRIRKEAIKHQVPIVENKPVAQALFRVVEVGEYIPEKYYKAVAEIISYIYRMKDRK